MSIASSRGLLAAAGPDSLILTSTESIRNAYKGAKSKEEVVPLEPQLQIPIPRLSCLTFTVDGSHLVIAAEQGGGFAAFNTDRLSGGDTKSAFEVPTEGVAIKALVPNPAVELAHIVGVVLENGHLFLANLQEKMFAASESGRPTMYEGVTCMAWSPRGKAMIAGLQNGSAVQLSQTGKVMAVIPRPPELEAGKIGMFIPYRCL